MAKWLIHVEVGSARGNQTWRVEADSEEQAREIWEGGDGDLLHEELEADDQAISRVELEKAS